MALVLVVILFISFKTDNSNKDLVRRVIEIAVVSGEIPDYNLIKDQKNIVISSENLDPMLLSELKDIKLVVLTPEEIREKANKEGEFLYLRFTNIDIKISRASLALDNTWAAPDNSQKGYTSGGGMTITFHRFLGRWIEDKTRQNWIA
jgi:hypothetical protein